MDSERQPQKQTGSAGRALRFPINTQLSLDGVIRHHEEGFVMEMSDLDELQQPIIQIIPITHSNAAIQVQVELNFNKAVTLEGRWLTAPQDACGTGSLQITSLFLPRQRKSRL